MVGRKVSGPVSQELPSAPGRAPMGPGMWGSPHLHSPPMPIIFSGSGPHPLPLGQRFSNLNIRIFPGVGKAC